MSDRKKALARIIALAVAGVMLVSTVIAVVLNIR